MVTHDAGPVGAYGIALDGVPGGTNVLSPAPAGAPQWTLRTRPLAPGEERDDVLGQDHAQFVTYGGVLVDVDAHAHTIELAVPPEQPDDSIVHPFMAAACAVIAWWRGALVFHAGAVVVDGRAWGILGAKRAGKSTLIAELATAGVTVLADDVSFVEHGQMLCAPRFVDLRRGQAERYPSAVALGRVGARSRWRMPLGPAPWSAPLAGWVVLDWGEEIELELIPVRDRFPELGVAYGLSEPPASPQALMDAAVLPMFRLRRPRDMDRMPEVLSVLLSELGRGE